MDKVDILIYFKNKLKDIKENPDQTFYRIVVSIILFYIIIKYPSYLFLFYMKSYRFFDYDIITNHDAIKLYLFPSFSKLMFYTTYFMISMGDIYRKALTSEDKYTHAIVKYYLEIKLKLEEKAKLSHNKENVFVLIYNIIFYMLFSMYGAVLVYFLIMFHSLFTGSEEFITLNAGFIFSIYIACMIHGSMMTYKNVTLIIVAVIFWFPIMFDQKTTSWFKNNLKNFGVGGYNVMIIENGIEIYQSYLVYMSNRNIYLQTKDKKNIILKNNLDIVVKEIDKIDSNENKKKYSLWI